MAKKKPNKELVDFAVEARKQHLTYGQLQVRETLRKEREKREREEKLKKMEGTVPGDWWKGGGNDGCEKVSSAG